MNLVMLKAFSEELEKTALQKFVIEAQARGGKKSKNSTANHWAKSEGKKKHAAFMRDVGNNIGNTLKGFTTPVQSMKQGWNLGGWTQGQEARTMMGAKMPVGRLGQNWAKGKGIGRHLPGSKALTVGTSAMLLPGALKKNDPSGKGESRAQRIGRLVGSTAGSLIGTPFHLSGTLAGGILGEQAGNLAGKVVNKVTGYKKPTPQPAQMSPGVAT